MVLAADLNTHLRDNLNVTAPAVLTTAGDILYASGANTPARLAKSTTSTQYLANTGSSNIPEWNEVALATGVSGTLPVGNGGTGQTSLTTGAILIGNSTTAVTMVTQTTKGQILIGDGSGPPQMLGVGSNGEVLTAASGETTGVEWAAAAAGATEATQSDAEDEGTTNANRYLSPEIAKYHPGSAKAWVCYDQTAIDGTADLTGVDVSYNVISVVDDGTWRSTVSWDTDFSTAHYAMGFLVKIDAEEVYMSILTDPAAGSVSVITVDHSGSGREANFQTIIAFGDQ